MGDDRDGARDTLGGAGRPGGPADAQNVPVERDPLEAPSPTDLGETDWERAQEASPGVLVPFGLTIRQWRFVCFYLESWNAAKAAKQAGYAAKGNHGNAGFAVLHRPRVQAALRWVLEDRSRQHSADHPRILQELLQLAYSDIGDVAVWNADRFVMRFSGELPPHVRRCIRSITFSRRKDGSSTVRVEMYDKQKALELLGRHVGLFRDAAPDDNRGAFQIWRDAMLTEHAGGNASALPGPGPEVAPDADEGSEEP